MPRSSPPTTGHKIKAVLACHNETATGVTSDIAGVRRALDETRHPALLFVDGVSSIASIDFRMDEWGVDIAVCGSQKGFMLPGGLAILCVSPKALDAAKTAKLHRCYFDFADMIKTNKDGFFPYTPPMQLIRGLRTSVDHAAEPKGWRTSSPAIIASAKACAARSPPGT